MMASSPIQFATTLKFLEETSNTKHRLSSICPETICHIKLVGHGRKRLPFLRWTRTFYLAPAKMAAAAVILGWTQLHSWGMISTPAILCKPPCYTPQQTWQIFKDNVAVPRTGHNVGSLLQVKQPASMASPSSHSLPVYSRTYCNDKMITDVQDKKETFLHRSLLHQALCNCTKTALYIKVAVVVFCHPWSLHVLVTSNQDVVSAAWSAYEEVYSACTACMFKCWWLAELIYRTWNATAHYGE